MDYYELKKMVKTWTIIFLVYVVFMFVYYIFFNKTCGLFIYIMVTINIFLIGFNIYNYRNVKKNLEEQLKKEVLERLENEE